jgi:hypothetical protein
MNKAPQYLLSLLIVILTIGTTTVRAQVSGQIDSTIPFSFYVNNTRFPSGSYIIRHTNGSDRGALKISNLKDTRSVLFMALPAADRGAPSNTELLFKHVKNRYYLTKIYDAQNTFVGDVENRVRMESSNAMQAAKEIRVPATYAPE